MKNSIAYVGNAKYLTPFGWGEESNLESILDGKIAYSDLSLKQKYGDDFPVGSAGFIPDSFFYQKKEQQTRIDYIFDRLLKSMIQGKNKNIKYDNIFIYYKNVELFLRKTQLGACEFIYKTNEQTVQEILKSNGIEIELENIYIIDNTCATGLTLLGFASQGIFQGLWSNSLVCSIDLIESHKIYMLDRLGALSRHEKNLLAMSRPFDERRNGFIKTESASIAVVSSDNSVFGDECLMKIRSFSQNNDGYKLTDGRDDALYIKEAMANALKNAELTGKDLAFIKAHGTATKLNDEHEAKAISELFPDLYKEIPITSLKGHLGHTTDASGLIENLIAADALKKGIILPTKNCEQLAFDLNIVRNPMREVKSKFFLSNSFGFGGNNASAVFEVV